MARKTYVPLSSRYSENPKGTRATYSYTMGGFPPGSNVLIYDLLYQIETNNTYRGVVAANCLIEDDGFLRLTGLRSSRYSAEFQSIDHIGYNFTFEVGDPDEYTNLVYHEIPYPVILYPMTTALDGSYNAYIRLDWALDSHNIDGFYEIWLASGIAGSYFLVTTLKNPKLRTYSITNVDYNYYYRTKIKTINEDGLSKGFSNEVVGTTPINPNYSGVIFIDTAPPSGQYIYPM